MDFDNPNVYGDIFVSDGLVFKQTPLSYHPHTSYLMVRLVFHSLALSEVYLLIFNLLTMPSGWHEMKETFDNCKLFWKTEGFSTDDCKAACLKNEQCTAFNHMKMQNSTTPCKQPPHGPCSQCKLLKCPLPIVAPIGGDKSGYRGYYQTGRQKGAMEVTNNQPFSNLNRLRDFHNYSKINNNN